MRYYLQIVFLLSSGFKQVINSHPEMVRKRYQKIDGSMMFPGELELI